MVRLLLMVFVALAAFAQNMSAAGDKKVTATYRYIASKNETSEQAEQVALIKAQTQVIGEEYGTIVEERSTLMMQSNGDESFEEFFSLGESDVRGEWIQTTKGPEFKHSFENGQHIVEVEVSGVIREIVSAKVDLDIRLLFQGTDEEQNRLRNNTFQNKDRMFLYFKSPVEGYLAVYIVDDDDMRNPEVACLLPYQWQDGVVHVEAGKAYTFFSKEKADLALLRHTRGMRMTCRDQVDYNHFYIIFSPKPFTKAVDAQVVDNRPPSLRFTEFQKWLGKNRKHDRSMQVEKISVMVKQ